MKQIFLTIFLAIYSFSSTINLDNYFNKNSSIMLLIDPSTGNIVKANKSASEFYGYSLFKLNKMKIQDINTFTKEQVKQEMSRAKSENRNYFLFRHKLANGDIKRVEVYSHPITYNGKKVLYSIIHDISNLELAENTIKHYNQTLEKEVDIKTKELLENEEKIKYLQSIGIFVLTLIIVYLLITIKRRKETEKKLFKSEKELQDIINSFPIPIIKANTKVKEMVFFNKSFKELFGWELEDIKSMEKWFTNAYPNEKYRDEIKKNWQILVDETHKSNSNTSSRSALAKITTKDNQVKVCHVWYHYNDDNMFGIFYDVTKQLELEDENLEQQKMMLIQSKIAAVGEMLGNIAHQWRQPLSIISTQVSGLKVAIEFQGGVSDNQIITCVDEVMSQSEHLSQTIDDFKNFFSSDHESINEFNITKTMEKIKALIKDSLDNNYIQVIPDLDDVFIIQNENQLIQAILNICNNAKDAMVLNNIDYEQRYVFISTKKHGDHAIIKFKDSAGGIESKNIDKVFEPYFTTKHKSMGTGIGLYMTHQIITKKFLGEIEVINKEYEYENKKLKGAEFSIKIPLDANIKR